ncbi:hypothetical protein V6x_44270 [Gimesia chilikensis]|uniref:Glycosyl hydrolase family 32 N-terminal domain-containing protein n=1 Tax=Gimesia chilikensis TaxID=2605989 RepID=A0A517WHF9_9PLAN|nr:hypothetical protein [Gimesia chilikensis]QDU04697.1 hypothetical protein V6x_44270 [Gimesia chilikensis]
MKQQVLRGLIWSLPMLLPLSAFAQPVDIGSRRELFVDRLLIDKLQGVELKLHTPVKAPRPRSPLPVRHMMTVIKNGDRYQAYWRGSDPDYQGEKHTGHAGETVHYAESRDGHEWEFPELGLHEVGGTRKNNVILAQQPPFLTNFTPFLDSRPGVDPQERYKALAGYPGPGDKRGLTEPGRGLFAFVSSDGIHWTKQTEVIPYQPQWRHAFDSANVSFWSEAEQQYVCYFRTWTDPERLRSVSRTTSPDFRHWTDPVAMDPNLPGEHLYTNQTHPYFRAPHIYISLPTRFIPGRGSAPDYDLKDQNATDILLMTTRAGSSHYDRLFKHAFIRPGLEPEQWKNRANYVALNVVSTSPTEMSIYHRSGDRYVLRTDGFVSVNAGYAAGELLTRPLVFAGDRLRINFSTSAAGSLRGELQQSDGTPIPGFTRDDCIPLIGDEIDGQVRWKSDADLSTLAGKPVRLCWILQECDLYSFQFSQ